ncbi:hypothetical protein XENTR_v10010947 [Xenopus tropicalis]|nr:hypothetical protein XENTR_v10010947 [Xenopus tropicalis]
MRPRDSVLIHAPPTPLFLLESYACSTCKHAPAVTCNGGAHVGVEKCSAGQQTGQSSPAFKDPSSQIAAEKPIRTAAE